MWVVAETYECPADAGLAPVPHAAPNASFAFYSEEGHGPHTPLLSLSRDVAELRS